MQAAHGGHDAHVEFLKIPITLPQAQVKLTVDRHACCWDFVTGQVFVLIESRRCTSAVLHVHEQYRFWSELHQARINMQISH